MFEKDATCGMLDVKTIWRRVRHSQWFATNQKRKNFTKKKLLDYLANSPFFKDDLTRTSVTSGFLKHWAMKPSEFPFSDST